MRVGFHIPTRVEVLIPGVKSRAQLPPMGWFYVYKDQLLAGVRFPLHPFLLDLLNHYQMPLAQIAPNGVRILIRFLLTYLENKVEPSVDLFRYFFQLRRGVQAKGYRFFQSRMAWKIGTPKTTNVESQNFSLLGIRVWGW